MRLAHKFDNKGHERTVVMFHPFPASSRVFHAQVPIWNESFNTLRFDLPGFGQSKALKKFTIDEYVYLTRDLIEKYKISSKHTIFYGISFGGIVALEYSKKYHVPKIIFESTPFNKKMIQTKEIKAIDILKQFILKTNSLDLFQKELSENKVLQNIFMAVYKMVKPPSQNDVKPSEIIYYMRHLDLNTIFQIAEYFKTFNIVKDLKSSPAQKVFLYDKFDPTVPYSYFNRVISKYGTKITTEYRTHAPSSIFGKEIAPMLINAVV